MLRDHITIGSDAEFFLMTRYGGIIPATAFNTPGTKEIPLPLEGGTFHRDNLSVEIQPDPGGTPEEFRTNCISVRMQLANMYDSMHLDLFASPVAHFDDEMVAIPEAQEIGCEADHCAYEGTKQEPASASAMGNLRTSSGHIQIGNIDDLSPELRRGVVRHLDMLEGPLLALEDIDADTNGGMRRYHYGQAGRYRLKPYGLEWRTPSSSNWAVYVHQRGAERLFSAVHAAVAMTDAGVDVVDLVPTALLRELRTNIDTGNYAGCVDAGRRVRTLYGNDSVASSILTEAEERFDRLPGINSL